MTATSRRRPSNHKADATIWAGAYFLSPEIASFDLEAWEDILPEGRRIVGANLFADVFLEDTGGRVHMLETAANRVSPIAESRERFLVQCRDDWNGWLMRPLVDRCREQGMMPDADQCFAMTTLPQFGGTHEVGNLWLCDWRAWLGYAGFVCGQSRDLGIDSEGGWRPADLGHRDSATPTWRA